MITLTDVRKVFGDGDRAVRALDGISLRIEAGEFVAIVGPSGSGKSTLLQIIGCLDTPTGGSYELDGVPVSGMDDLTLSHLRNRKIGFVFQNFNLVARTTALENVEVPMLYGDETPSRERAQKLLERVGMAQRADHFPHQLSGGEQQRVAIARALVMQPSLLIADEPTGNLDSATGDQIMTILGELHRSGLTIVMVTHDPMIAARAGRILTMADGRIVNAPVRDHTDASTGRALG
jgi:putative ABC transport system ATP-binding protein